MLHIYAIPEKTLQKHFEGNHSVKSSKNKTQMTRMTALITLCLLMHLMLLLFLLKHSTGITVGISTTQASLSLSSSSFQTIDGAFFGES